MPGRPSLGVFALRAIVLLPVISVLWAIVAERYDGVLALLASGLVPDAIALHAVGTRILVDPTSGPPLSVDGLLMHFGLILAAAVVLASVGLPAAAKARWLAGILAATFAMHILGLAILTRGIEWASASSSPQEAGRLVLSLFSAFWGLAPAIILGLWCLLYWMPRATPASVRSEPRDPQQNPGVALRPAQGER